MSERSLFEIASDIRNIIRGGIAADDDVISVRQISDWIRSAYCQVAQQAILQIPPGKMVNETWVNRYTCLPISYPAEAPCGCEKLGFYAGRIQLPQLLTRYGGPAIEWVTLPGYGEAFVKGSVDTVKSIVTGSGIQKSLQNRRHYSAWYYANDSIYIIGNPHHEKPSCLTLHIAQSDPMIRLDQGETEYAEEMGERPCNYADQFIRAIRLEVLSKEATMMMTDLIQGTTDLVNDSSSKPA